MTSLRRPAWCFAFLLLAACGKVKLGKQSIGNDSRLFPLEQGRTWVYDVEAKGPGSTCRSKQASRTASPTKLDGRSAFALSAICPAPGSAVPVYSMDGERVLERQGTGTWVTALDLPPEEDKRWSAGLQTFVWTSANTVVVPAGTFTGCWTRHQVDTTSTVNDTFCPGVGLVSSDVVNLIGDGYAARLHLKNF
jgi:hypothetical protein